MHQTINARFEYTRSSILDKKSTNYSWKSVMNPINMKHACITTLTELTQRNHLYYSKAFLFSAIFISHKAMSLTLSHKC